LRSIPQIVDWLQPPAAVLVGTPRSLSARDRADRLAVPRVAIEDLAHDPRLGLVDLQERVDVL
jgi:hypothetical protein